MDVTSLDTVRLSISRRESCGHERGSALHSRAARGELVRLRRGVYADSGAWSDATPSRRYAALLLAAAETRSFTPVFSHVSAAFIWGLPIIGRWPVEAHLMSMGQRGLHSKNGVVWHHDTISADDVTELRGLLVTTLERTLLDVAKTGSFVSAVASIDFATKRSLALPDGTTAPGVNKGALLERLRRDGPRRGSAVARDAIEFSDARSGSPGESLSRVQIHRLGFPPPRLQTAGPPPRRRNRLSGLRMGRCLRRVRRVRQIHTRRVHKWARHGRDRLGREASRGPPSLDGQESLPMDLGGRTLALCPRRSTASGRALPHCSALAENRRPCRESPLHGGISVAPAILGDRSRPSGGAGVHRVL